MHEFKRGDVVMYPSPFSSNYREPVKGIVADVWTDLNGSPVVTVKPIAGGLSGCYNPSDLTPVTPAPVETPAPAKPVTYKVTTENAYGVDIFETSDSPESILAHIRHTDAAMNHDERTIRIVIEEVTEGN